MDTNYGSLGDQIAELKKLTEENNRMLRALRRDRWIGLLLNILVWGAVLLASYYFTAQYIEPMWSQLEKMQGGEIDFAAILEQYRQQMGE